MLDHSPCATEPLTFRRREALCSLSWEEQFGRPDRWPPTLRANEFSFVAQAEHAALWESTASGELALATRAKEMRAIRVEAFSNTWRVFVLLGRARSGASSAIAVR